MTSSDSSQGPLATSLSRRQVLTKGGLMLGFALTMAGHVRLVSAQEKGEQPPNPSASDTPPEGKDSVTLNAFIRIPASGPITLILPSIEMGQGTHTAEVMLIAEELDVNLDQVQAFDAPADAALYANPLLKMQATGGSSSVRAMWKPLREAGATARQMLIAAAAAKWGVDAASCTTKDGTVVHQTSGRSEPYGALAEAASKAPVPKNVGLKDPKDFRLIGKSLPRVDTPAKSNGSAVYGIDVQVPDMKIATLRVCPVPGGKVKSVHDTRARAMPGVIEILKIDAAVCVVSDSYWTALQAVKALDVEWDYGPNADVSTESMFKSLKDASKNEKPLSALKRGDFADALKGAAKTVTAEYTMPFWAHAAMEPMTCTIHAKSDGADVWLGTQVPVAAQVAIAKALNLAPESVVIHNHYLGGSYGQRLFPDPLEHAAGFAKQVPYPLKMIWSREEDMTQDRYRPIYYDKLSAGIGPDGKITAWQQAFASGSATAYFVPGSVPEGTVDPDASSGSVDPPYDFPVMQVDWLRHDPPLPIGYWRGVGFGHNFFVIESFIDECAWAAGVDPVKFRENMLEKSPRALGVLKLAAEKSGWGSKLPEGSGRGVSLHNSFGSFAATVLEVSVNKDTGLKVVRAVVAVDCGATVNPNVVAAQIEGGFVFGLSAAMYNEITVANGRVEQKNFDDYRILRMNEMPIIEVHRIESQEAPGGIGEVGTVSAPPALANAIYAATRKRQRFLPIDVEALISTSDKGSSS